MLLWLQGVEFSPLGGMAGFAEWVMELFTDTEVVRRSSAKHKGSSAFAATDVCSILTHGYFQFGKPAFCWKCSLRTILEED